MRKIPWVRVGLLVALSPILIAFLYSIIKGGSMFNEASGGGGYLWFFLLTIPVGFLISLIGLLVKVYQFINSKRKQ